MAFVQQYHWDLYSLSAAAYASASDTQVFELEEGCNHWAGYAHVNDITGSGNLKIKIDHMVLDPDTESFPTLDAKRLCTFSTFTAASSKETAFMSASAVGLLPYIRMTAEYENTGAAEGSFNTIVVKLLTGDL